MRWPRVEQFAEATVPPAVGLLAWLAGVGAVIALAFLRTQTEAEYGIASAVLLPIVAVTWLSGRTSGLLLTAVAMVAWTVADVASGLRFNTWWAPYVNGVTRFLTYSFVTLVVSRLRGSLVRERLLSSYDALTGVLNRRTFLEAGASEVDRARRYRHPLAVAFLDLDNFKSVNDSEGHHAEAHEAATKLADTLRRRLAHYPPVSASIGIAWFAGADREFAEMLRAADALMYAIKKDGKNGIRIQRLEAAPSPRPGCAGHQA